MWKISNELPVKYTVPINTVEVINCCKIWFVFAFFSLQSEGCLHIASAQSASEDELSPSYKKLVSFLRKCQRC